MCSASGSPRFTGIKAKYVPSKAAALNKESAFTVLTTGQTVEITHNLADVYNFTSAGEGAYTVSLLPLELRFIYLYTSSISLALQTCSTKSTPRAR
jgi:hypothetical protein